MEFICELIFEIILEGFFGLTVENPKAKTWTKTVIFLLFAEGMSAFLIWIGTKTYLDGNTSGGVVCIIISVAMAIGFLIGAIYGHKRNWKQDF